MGYQVVWRWQFSMVQGPNLCCGLYVYMILSHIPPIENFPMTLHEFLLCYCWVPALVNAFFPGYCQWRFPRVLSMFSRVLSLMFSPSLLNVFPSHCHCLVSLMSWGWPLSNAICMLENTTNAIRLKDNKSYHGIIIKADGASIFRTRSWLSKQGSVVFVTP